MKDLFVPYEIALLAKENGFDDECFEWWYSPTQRASDLIFRQYKGDKAFCDAPLYQQLTDWFREKHDLHISINYIDDIICFNSEVTNIKSNTVLDGGYNSVDYHQALNSAIKEAFKLI